MNMEELKALIDVFSTSTLIELEYRTGGTTVRMRRAVSAQVLQPAARPAPAPQSMSVPPAATFASRADPGLVRASGSGVFHRAPEPDAAPFVVVGSKVEIGQKLAVLEAMKVFTSIVAPRAGEVVEILVADGEEVETGTPLLRIA